MQADKIRRIAASLLKVGVHKVWLDPAAGERIKEAMTKEDVRGLVVDGVARKRREKGHSRGRARVLRAKKQKGRKGGKGKRMGTKKARLEPKSTWMRNVRAQRRTLKELRKKREIKEGVSYRRLYNLVKGGQFRGKKYVEAAARGEGQ